MSLSSIACSYSLLTRSPVAAFNRLINFGSTKYTLNPVNTHLPHRSFSQGRDVSARIEQASSTLRQNSKATVIKYPPLVPHQFAQVGNVIFPAYSGIWCNMLPFKMGDKNSVPSEYQRYWSLIEACNVPKEELGKVGYLTIRESDVGKDASQSRGGIHTEKHPNAGWGGGWGGGRALGGGWGGGGWGGGSNEGSGLYMASTIDNTCRVWNCYIENPGHMGNCEHLEGQLKGGIDLKANQLVWLTDSCPHEALPQKESGKRQWFRLVTSHVDLWYKAHSTLNPLVELPKGVKVIEYNKFAKNSCEKS